MKKVILLDKIDLLTISLETIFLNNRINIIDIKNLHSDLRNKNYNKIQKFSLLLIYIYKITKIIRENNLEVVAKNIIKNDKSIERYIIKFSYIYFRNRKFYSNYKSLIINKLQKTNINRFAISTIYLISELNNNKGIYKIVRFLNE